MASNKKLQQLRNSHQGAKLFGIIKEMLAYRDEVLQKNLAQNPPVNMNKDMTIELQKLDKHIVSWSTQLRPMATLLAGSHVERLYNTLKKQQPHYVKKNTRLEQQQVNPAQLKRSRPENTNTLHDNVVVKIQCLKGGDAAKETLRKYLCGLQAQDSQLGFTPPEVKRILQDMYDTKHREWASAVKLFLQMKAGISESAMKKFVTTNVEIIAGKSPERRKRQPPILWGRGRGVKFRRLVDQPTLSNFINSRGCNEALTRQELMDFLNDAKEKRIKQAGGVFELQRDAVSKVTVDRYIAFASLENNVAPPKRAIHELCK